MSATNSEYPKVTETRLNEIRFRAEHGMEIADPPIPHIEIDPDLIMARYIFLTVKYQDVFENGDPDEIDEILDHL